VYDGQDIQDTTAWGGVVALGWKINDSNTIEGSFATVTADIDLPGSWEDKRQVFGLMWKHPGFFSSMMHDKFWVCLIQSIPVFHPSSCVICYVPQISDPFKTFGISNVSQRFGTIRHLVVLQVIKVLCTLDCYRN
jgi:hypothetical protein